MTMLDIVLRSMAGMQLLFLACLLLARSRTDPALRYAALLPTGLAAFMLTSAPLPAGSLAAAGLPLTAVCVANPAWFWIFTRAWFDDRFRPGWIEAAAVIAMIAVGLAHEVGAGGSPSAGLDATFKAAILTFVGLAVLNVVRGRGADLDERRRRARVGFVLAVFGYAMASIALQVAYDGRLPRELVAANIAFLLVVAFCASVWLALRGSGRMPDEPVAMMREVAAASTSARVAPGAAATTVSRPRSVVDDALVARIRSAMEADRLYHRESLTVAGLAEALGSQEYRVRRAINQGLGYRNFNEFLHRYRLDEASVRLRTQRHLPILTIALDVGFGSIGPFNRAFRARFGCTPSDYRSGSGAQPAHIAHDEAPAPGAAAV